MNSAKSAASVNTAQVSVKSQLMIVDINCGGIVFFQRKQKLDCYRTEGVLIKKKEKKTSLVMQDNDYSTPKKYNRCSLSVEEV